MTAPADIETLAAATANAFFEACGEPERWRLLPEFKRERFRQMVRQALATARTYREVRGLEIGPTIARVLSDAFFAAPDCPYWLRHQWDWTHGLRRLEARPIFLAAAEHLIAEGRALNAARRPADVEAV